MRSLPTDKLISCFYDSSEDCVKVLDVNGTLMSFNPNGFKIMEIDDPKAVIGKDWLAFWKGNLHDIASAAFEKARAGTLAKFEGYCPTFKGTMKYWEVTIAPLHNEYGDVQWLLVSSRDETRRKNTEEEVKRLRKRVVELEKMLPAVSR